MVQYYVLYRSAPWPPFGSGVVSMSHTGWTAIAFLGLGIMAVVGGFRTVQQVRTRRRRWKPYVGEAVDYVWRSEPDGRMQYWILRWRDDQGIVRTAENRWGSSGGTLRSFPFPVQILVDPDNPERAVVARGAHSGVATGIVFVLVGLMFCGLGTAVAIIAF